GHLGAHARRPSRSRREEGGRRRWRPPPPRGRLPEAHARWRHAIPRPARPARCVSRLSCFLLATRGFVPHRRPPSRSAPPAALVLLVDLQRPEGRRHASPRTAHAPADAVGVAPQALAAPLEEAAPGAIVAREQALG